MKFQKIEIETSFHNKSYYLHSEILFVNMVEFFFALLNKIMLNPNSTQHLLLKSQVPIHKHNGGIELRRIKDLGLGWAIELAMISDKISSSELGRLQKELTSKEKATALLRAAAYINYDKLCVSGESMEKLLREMQIDVGIKLTARRVQQALQEWKKMREEKVAACDFEPRKQACGRKDKLSDEAKDKRRETIERRFYSLRLLSEEKLRQELRKEGLEFSSSTARHRLVKLQACNMRVHLKPRLTD